MGSVIMRHVSKSSQICILIRNFKLMWRFLIESIFFRTIIIPKSHNPSTYLQNCKQLNPFPILSRLKHTPLVCFPYRLSHVKNLLILQQTCKIASTHSLFVFLTIHLMSNFLNTFKVKAHTPYLFSLQSISC